MRKDLSRMDTYYVMPNGKRARRHYDVEKFLKENPKYNDTMAPSSFSFSAPKIVKETVAMSAMWRSLRWKGARRRTRQVYKPTPISPSTAPVPSTGTLPTPKASSSAQSLYLAFYHMDNDVAEASPAATTRGVVTGAVRIGVPEGIVIGYSDSTITDDTIAPLGADARNPPAVANAPH
ncbi:hypothetical protein GUJ93_ZPchr0005g14338 [Zizania palustris]|uniref:MBD domain-containing protein n=1 Tax=Zizania palustris TaxID=103762 RepID=A0A8J5T533_ZIZPA|nr:hypothetical protein GUJ93_ZPchr0005g14338 [Zizania palustris]